MILFIFRLGSLAAVHWRRYVLTTLVMTTLLFSSALVSARAESATGVLGEKLQDTMLALAKHGELRDISYTESVLKVNFSVSLSSHLMGMSTVAHAVILSLDHTSRELLGSSLQYLLFLQNAQPIRASSNAFAVASFEIFPPLSRVCVDPSYLAKQVGETGAPLTGVDTSYALTFSLIKNQNTDISIDFFMQRGSHCAVGASIDEYTTSNS